jgi:hypothetical protein
LRSRPVYRDVESVEYVREVRVLDQGRHIGYGERRCAAVKERDGAPSAQEAREIQDSIGLDWMVVKSLRPALRGRVIVDR